VVNVAAAGRQPFSQFDYPEDRLTRAQRISCYPPNGKTDHQRLPRVHGGEVASVAPIPRLSTGHWTGRWSGRARAGRDEREGDARERFELAEVRLQLAGSLASSTMPTVLSFQPATSRTLAEIPPGCPPHWGIR